MSQGQHKCLKELLEESMCGSDECTLFKCDARLGKVVWRHRNGDKLQDLVKSPKASEFYTRYGYLHVLYMYMWFYSNYKTYGCITSFICLYT